MSRLHARLAALAVAALLPAASWSTPALHGSRTLSATLGDGSRVVLGRVEFSPAANGRSSFTVRLRSEPFSDHFLSMREFKCLAGGPELSCHVPYPYAQPGTVSPDDLTWLEHSLLFFYKTPRDFGAKLWNGLYFEFKVSGQALVGTPRAVDLNQIAAPPPDAARPPFGAAQRHDMAADARWLRTLVIE